MGQGPGRKRTINHRPIEGSVSQPIQVNLGKLLEAFPDASIDLDGFTAELIIRIEVVEIEVKLKFHEPDDLREEIPGTEGEEEEQN
jgi:hypothetical protein